MLLYAEQFIQLGRVKARRLIQTRWAKSNAIDEHPTVNFQ